MHNTAFLGPAGQLAAAGHLSASNLPAYLTPLIGREHEVEVACTLLRRDDVRLLTLTGPGGVGKTRLSLQIATDLINTFPDGVCFVSLASISDPELVLPTIIQTLGFGEAGDVPPLERLKAFLREKHILLLLDNFEQVITAATPLQRLLKDCQHVKMLVTSREIMRIQHEREFPVPPLALPDLKHLPDIETLSQGAAVALFTQRALALRPDFVITPANAHSVAEICTRLDGLPLAIELAAARINLLSPEALLKRLVQTRLRVLTSGVRDIPARQQTLRSTIQWSYDLLDREQQRLLQRLAVFVGGSSLDAVEAIYATLGNTTINVLDGVRALLDKSLIQQTGQARNEPRLLMLETIREYGLECLSATGEIEAARHAHAVYYLALAEEAQLQTAGTQQVIWLQRLEQEHDNLRTALRWLIEQEEAELAMRLSGALWWFWSVRGHLSEGLQWLERTLARKEKVAALVGAKALYGAGSLAFALDDHGRAEAHWQESLNLYQQINESTGIANTLYKLGLVAWARGDYATASSLAEQALTLFRKLSDNGGIADTYLLLAHVAIDQSEYAGARTLIEQSLAIFRASGDTWGLAYSMHPLALVIFLQGDPERAYTLIHECLELCRELDYKSGIAFALGVQGQIALSEGDGVTARSLIEESLAIRRELGDRWGIADSLCLLAKVSFSHKDYTTAQDLYEQSFAIARDLGDSRLIATCLKGLEVVAMIPPVSRATSIAIPPPAAVSTSPAKLTTREVEVLRLIAMGLTDSQVAEKLVISPRTVNAHLTSIYSKIQVSTRSAATRYAIEHKLV